MHSPVKVWDWSIRVYHWLMLLLITLLFFSGRISEEFDALEHHMSFAQLLMGLIVYRIIWGFIGTPSARFSHFLAPPATAWRYVQSVLKRQPYGYLGHNPLGGWMVILLIAALCFQLLSGLFTTDDLFYSGPLVNSASGDVVRWMSRTHRQFFDLILILVGLHILAIIVHRFLGESLVLAMFTGKKHLEKPAEDAEKIQLMPEQFPWLRFVLAVMTASILVGWIFYR